MRTWCASCFTKVMDARTHVTRTASASIPPLAMDASAEDGGFLSNVDARALTSLAALALALTVVCAIAIVGHIKHANGSTEASAQADLPPLVNEGVEIATPEINLQRSSGE